METNVQHFGQSANIPAGIFYGTEIFAHRGELYAIYNGVRILFQDLPGMEKRNFVEMYMKDKESQDFIRKQFGITGFESGFRQWLFCKFGALDGDPDSIDDQITPDTYNSACQRTDCPGRGKICGSDIALRSHEIATLRELKSGKTAKEMADALCISESAVKSRIEKLKDKFNVANAVALIGIVTELGI